MDESKSNFGLFMLARISEENGWLAGCILWHINPCGLFDVKSYLYIYIMYYL